MRKLFVLLAVAFLFPVSGHAQSEVQYIYDNAGNRIRLTVPSNRSDNTFGNDFDDNQKRILSGTLAGHSVSITILDSQGLIKVEILGISDSDECRLSLFSTSGIMIASKSADTMPVTFDISQCRKGIYILQITLNGETASWKIIKR